MTKTTVVLVNGEVLIDMPSPSIESQKQNATRLANGLTALLDSPDNLFIMHGNKPQIGAVLFRSEIASPILYPIPLDVCGADTQGATGYMLSQVITNTLKRLHVSRSVVSMVTQTLVDFSRDPNKNAERKAIGPWYDRSKADLYRQTRGWEIIEDQGHGYRRSVPLYHSVEVIEKNVILDLVNRGVVVIAAGGGGIPVVSDRQGNLVGIEAVVDTEEVACSLARELAAETLLMVVENNNKFVISGLSVENKRVLTDQELEDIYTNTQIESSTVKSKIQAAIKFLRGGGREVIITTLLKLPDALKGEIGLFVKRSN